MCCSNSAVVDRRTSETNVANLDSHLEAQSGKSHRLHLRTQLSDKYGDDGPYVPIHTAGLLVAFSRLQV